MRIALGLALCATLLVSCSPQNDADPTVPAGEPAAIQIVLVGDVMLGRAIAPLVASAPDELFAGVRHLIRAADVAGLNLESPLTELPHRSANENILIADPASASVLAAAGFDIASLPNNHAGDAGPAGVMDTLASLAAVQLTPVGGGSDLAAASAPVIVNETGLRVGFLAFDATSQALGASAEPGVAIWDDIAGRAAIAALRPDVDVLVVSVHGGTEYLPTTDPRMEEIALAAVGAGADVLWGHGAHVLQPILVREGAVVATSLGNFLFDQSGPDRTTGALLEVLAGGDGVIAFRVARTSHADRTVEFVEWEVPEGDAAWLDGSWWSLVQPPALAAAAPAPIADFRHGDLVAAATGPVAADGRRLVVASFRRPFAETEFMRLRSDVQWEDAAGRSAHLGVYEPDGLVEVWVAGSVASPVAEIAVCDGAIAVAHDTLDDPGIVTTGAWEWNGFGFTTAPELPGAGNPGCADIDGDGKSEPVITKR